MDLFGNCICKPPPPTAKLIGCIRVTKAFLYILLLQLSKFCFSEERLALGKQKAGSPKSYGSRSDLHSSTFIPPTIRMDEPSPEGSEPVETTCKYCYKMVTTQVQFVANEKTYTICLLLFVLLLWPFIWIPFCCDKCKEAIHKCPNCGSVLSSTTRT